MPVTGQVPVRSFQKAVATGFQVCYLASGGALPTLSDSFWATPVGALLWFRMGSNVLFPQGVPAAVRTATLRVRVGPATTDGEPA